MIGIDRKTGKMITGFEQFVSRLTQVMTTRIGSREKRRKFGSRLPDLLSRSTSDHLLALAQTYAMEAFYNAENGIQDFTPTRIVATRRQDGITLQFAGTWNDEWIESFEINVKELERVT